MADAGYSVRRVRRHFADVQVLILTGRFGASSSESRPSEVGHFRSSDWSGNRRANDRFQSTAAIRRRPLKHHRSPKQSPDILRRRSRSDAGRTPAVRSAELPLPTHRQHSPRRIRRHIAVAHGAVAVTAIAQTADHARPSWRIESQLSGAASYSHWRPSCAGNAPSAPRARPALLAGR